MEVVLFTTDYTAFANRLATDMDSPMNVSSSITAQNGATVEVLESPPKVYYAQAADTPATSGATTPAHWHSKDDAHLGFAGTPAESLDARLAGLQQADYFRREASASEPSHTARANLHRATTSADARPSGMINWLKHNQRFLACLWSIGTCRSRMAHSESIVEFIQVDIRPC